MSLHTTAPPRRDSSTANAAPIPLPAPVTTAEACWLVFALRVSPSISAGLLDFVGGQRFCDELRGAGHRLGGFR